MNTKHQTQSNFNKISVYKEIRYKYFSYFLFYLNSLFL
jgi:hypothetical protein